MNIPIEAVIEAMLIMLSLRSEMEVQHGLRVAKLSIRVGEEIGMPPKELENISISSRLHDIGKIGVLGATLAKAGSPTQGEWAMLKKHPDFSRDILAPLGLDPIVLLTVDQHHENYDGSGYPKGLKGESIVLPARILRVTDVYDSLLSNRSYRNAFNRDEAVEIMWGMKRFFDPLLLDVFERLDFDRLEQE